MASHVPSVRAGHCEFTRGHRAIVYKACEQNQSKVEIMTTIRPATATDVAALKAVIDAVGLFPSELLDSMMAGYFDGTSSDDIWATMEDVEPIAIMYYAPERMTEGTWNVLLIAVHPDHQDRGYGAALMRHAEDALTGRGQRVLLVETSGLEEFERTRTFYDRLGYDREARIRDYYETGNDKIIFRKLLASPSD